GCKTIPRWACGARFCCKWLPVIAEPTRNRYPRCEPPGFSLGVSPVGSCGKARLPFAVDGAVIGSLRLPTPERPMRMLRLFVGAAALIAVTVPAAAASRADWDACNCDDPDRSIPDCTRIIERPGESAKNYAAARHQRGLAYRAKGDLDRAIADLTEAVRLDPKYAEAYYVRGVSYGKKGDVERAIAD